MPFKATSDLLLSQDKAAQLTKALSVLGVHDPLQYLCDEAAADVARYITGYVLEENQVRGFVRSLALFAAYSLANVPVPKDVQTSYDGAIKELEAIAKGERPNLPRVQSPSAGGSASVGGWGSRERIL